VWLFRKAKSCPRTAKWGQNMQQLIVILTLF
jgi:hypothetical protein